MKKLFTFILSMLLMSSIFAQTKPEAIAMKAETKPVMDGVMEEVWETANKYDLVLPFTGETPTLGEAGETNYRILWDDDGIYVFITVTDDVHVPNWYGTGTGYKYDFPEITFDVNYILLDGEGPQENNGHYQIDDHILEADIDGTPKTNPGPIDLNTVAFLVDDPNYTAEYFIPFSMLITKDGGLMDKTQEIGFDVYISDNDVTSDLNAPVRNRVVWANQGEITETWDNMDNSGILILDGAEGAIFVDEINLVGEDITVNGQAMQLDIEILPEDAEDKNLRWIIKGVEGEAARATVSATGLVTPLIDEVITLQATSSDGFTLSNMVTINITGQKPTKESLSYIKNGNFNEVDSTGAPLMWSGFPEGTATVVDGVLNFGPTEVGSIWNYKMLQIIHVPYELKDLDYVLSFTAWADEERSFQLKIEDQANGWATYGVSSDETSDGTSLWPADLMRITKEPTRYELHMTFENMAENANQNFNWQVADTTIQMYLDSVYLVSVADMDLIGTATAPDYKAEADFMVYPNPAVDRLHIELATVNTRVSIYNSVGIKMEETVVDGTRHTFDVSRYAKGMYFVRANDGIRKFIK